jgi:cell volume regulation protein A
MPEQILLIGAGLLFVSILFTKISAKLGVPALVAFLIVGIFAGPEGIGHITVHNPDAIQLVGIFALITILFSGGFETEWADLRPVIGRGLLLATIGLCITAGLVAAIVHVLFATTWLEGLLFGSIISCTDVAAVFSVLRSRSLLLRAGLGPIAEFESAANDPTAVILTLAIIQLIRTPGSSVLGLVPEFFLQMIVGVVCGAAMGFVIPKIINWLDLEHDGLYSPLTLALAILTYSLASALHGSGYLAAYVAGVMMNRQGFYQKKSLKRFLVGVSWLAQIVMFVTLGLILRPSHVADILPQGLLISAFLIFFARPVSVIATLFLTKMTMREMLMVSWLGLRGAVPIILGTFTLYSGLAVSQLIFDLVFVVVLLSVLIQGTTLVRVAKLLRVTIPADPTV